ncbi:iron-containing alcohol dehydrogenase [Moorella naiadis]|uniref:iron-containing alcohol dehydrogenase n=1 Tax=Moorella naiadis (nom. illeg.) TaxID=3093670 RepID=UPI003D9C99D2
MATDSFLFRMDTPVLFGDGVTQKLAEKVKDFKASRVLVVTDKGVKQAGILEKVEQLLQDDGLEVIVFDEVEPDPSLETIHKGADFFKQVGCDLMVTLGGGSPIDTAKGIRVIVDNGGHIRDYAGVNKVPQRASVPLITIPTTSGTGSEVTIFAVLSDWEYNMKITITSPYLAADLALVDPLLTVSAPPRITAASGIDALAHAIETYVSNISQPPADALALKAIQIIGANLRPAVANGNNLAARNQMALGSLMAGMAFNNAFLGITHSIGAALSGHVHVSHGIAIALLLPHVMEYNAMARLEKYRDIALALGEKVENISLREAALAAAKSVHELVGDVNLPQHLSELGVKEEDLPKIAKDTLGHGMVKMNPRKPTEADILAILRKAL